MAWDPAVYERYRDERGRPFYELVDRVRAQRPRRVVDLGCGAGTLTATLADRWPEAIIEGVDSSPEMIDAARQQPAGTFRVGDLAAWMPSPDTDVVISNAALQWVPDHVAVLRRWSAALPSGAWLAWQVPGNFDAASHTIMRDLAESGRWAEQLDGILRHQGAVAEPTAYARLLLDAGCTADVWATTYLHVLSGPDPVLEWMRGTGLRPVLAALSPDDAADFPAAYGHALRDAYPPPAGTIFPFHRIFAVGHKS